MGRLPFDDSNHKKLLRAVTQGPTFSERREVSSAYKDLVCKILTKQSERCSMKQIQMHEWFKSYCKSPPEPVLKNQKHKTK